MTVIPVCQFRALGPIVRGIHKVDYFREKGEPCGATMELVVGSDGSAILLCPVHDCA